MENRHGIRKGDVGWIVLHILRVLAGWKTLCARLKGSPVASCGLESLRVHAPKETHVKRYVVCLVSFKMRSEWHGYVCIPIILPRLEQAALGTRKFSCVYCIWMRKQRNFALDPKKKERGDSHLLVIHVWLCLLQARKLPVGSTWPIKIGARLWLQPDVQLVHEKTQRMGQA